MPTPNGQKKIQERKKKRGEHAWVLPLAKEKEKKRKRSVTRTVYMVIVFFFSWYKSKDFLIQTFEQRGKRYRSTDRDGWYTENRELGEP